MEEVLADRYTYPFFNLNYAIRADSRMQWADGKMVKNSVDALQLLLLGPKTEADTLMMKNKKKKGISNYQFHTHTFTHKETHIEGQVHKETHRHTDRQTLKY